MIEPEVLQYYQTLILIVAGVCGAMYFMKYFIQISWWMIQKCIWLLALYVILKLIGIV